MKDGPGSESRDSGGHFRSRPAGILLLVFRLPVYLYRINLGWLLGRRFLLLTHRGRSSGRVYRTVLEVVRHAPSNRESIVVSAWGERSDWYRNLRASVALEVETGRERYAPKQRFLTSDEVYREIEIYERRHPWAIRIIPRLL